ncbi:MAG TPA: EamA family transporter [Streptosporangiaceae bacterium]
MRGVVGLGFSAALIYGGSDFLGGFAARRLASLTVTLVAFVAGLVVTLPLLAVVSSAWTTSAVVYGAVAGVAGASSIWLLYACLAMGPISVLAPLVALLAALLPVAFGLARHEHLGPVGVAALCTVVVAGALLGYTPGGRGEPLRMRALVIAVLAGLATGGYLIALDFTPPDSGVAPVAVDFAAGAILLGLAIALRSRVRRRNRSCPVEAAPETQTEPLAYAAVSGGTQAVADVLVVIGIHAGHLAIMAALIALYPVGTIVLAIVITNERPGRLQLVGIALAIAASTVLSVS